MGAYGWYVKRALKIISECIEEEKDYNECSLPIILVGHSAGGWLARAVLGDGRALPKNVRALVTLGAPHSPPPDGMNCATRGALETTNSNYPGSFLSENGISYITVVGDALTGISEESMQIEEQERREFDDIYRARGEKSAQNVARINYQALLGKVDGVRGDGVIPVDIAHLDGAEQITIKGVLHSINEAGTTMPTDSWYGSEKIVDKWLVKTLDLIKNSKN